MKFVIAILLLTFFPGNELDKIARTNQLKKEAKQAYQAGRFDVAISKYHYLLDSVKIDDDRSRLNLANAYYQINDTTSAINNFGALTASNNKLIQSIAQQQLGVIQHKQQKYKEALESFKQALKADPANEEARYNYELLKKIVKEQEQQNQDQKQNKDQNKENKEQEQQNNQQNQDEQKNQEQKGKDDQNKDEEEQNQKEEKKQEEKDGKEKEKKEQEQEQEEQQKDGQPKDEEQKDGENKEMPMNRDKLQEMQISEEKAKMILEAMKNNEVQYIQQNRRKAKKPKETGKPDW